MMFELPPLKELSRTLQSLVENRLWAKVLIGLVLGVVTGALLGPAAGLVDSGVASTLAAWIALPGNLFIRLVQMIMVPLIVSSIIQGIAGAGNKDELRVLGPSVGAWFLVTTAISVGIGVGMATLIAPGLLVDATALGVDRVVGGATANGGIDVADMPRAISQLLPTNPLASMVSGEMLSVVIFAIVAGVALAAMPADNAAPVMKLLGAVQEICMTITRWAMRLAPFAVYGLITQVVARVGLQAIAGLAVYVGTVIAGLLVVVVMYVIILRVIARASIVMFFRESREVLLLAFSVASSAAVLPLSLKTAEERLHVAPSIARFVIPVGATINMNGTATYQATAALFLAQVYGLELSLGAMVLLVVTTVAASVGTPSTPGAGVVILATILTSIGIPVAGVALIIGVDALLGMCRTTVNVMGDLTAAMVFDRRRRMSAPAEQSVSVNASSAAPAAR